MLAVQIVTHYCKKRYTLLFTPCPKVKTFSRMIDETEIWPTIVLGTFTFAFDDTALMFYYWIYFITNKSMHFLVFFLSLRIT